MNEAVAEFVTRWAVVNVVAILFLAVAAYFSSVWVLDHLDVFDRWLDKSQRPSPDVSSLDDIAQPSELPPSAAKR